MKTKIREADLKALVLKKLRTYDSCENVIDVTVQRIADERVNYNWDISACRLGDTTARDCTLALSQFIPGLRPEYDLID